MSEWENELVAKIEHAEWRAEVKSTEADDLRKALMHVIDEVQVTFTMALEQGRKAGLDVSDWESPGTTFLQALNADALRRVLIEYVSSPFPPSMAGLSEANRILSLLEQLEKQSNESF